jgi:4-amino-4-deoxy-L-arabinose transferase-like glycosyltransferase
MINLFQQMQREQPRRWINLITLLLVGTAFIIRLVGLGAESGWLDEAYSIILARYPIAQILQGTAADQHPPLYYLLLHAWMWLGGGVTFARLLSALLGTINIFQVIRLGRQVGGEKLGFGAGFLLAISPFHVWYSQEARQYMLLVCLTTASTQAFWQGLHGKRSWIWYALFSTLALYTQYFAVFILFSHALLVGLWSWRNHNHRYILHWGVAMLATGLAFIPWLPTAIDQFLFHTMSWISDPIAGDVRDVLLRLLLGSGVLILPEVLRWLGLIGLVVVGAWALLRMKLQSMDFRLGFTFYTIWALAPFLAISLVSIFYPVFQFKQYLILLPPVLMTAVGMVLILPIPWRRLFFAGLVLSAGLTLGYQQSVLTKDDWRGVADYLRTQSRPGDLVFGNPAASSLALTLYDVKDLDFSGYPPHYDILTGGWEGQPLNPELVDAELTTVTRGHQRVWLIEFFPEFWDAKGLLPAWFASRGSLLDDQFFGNIHLRLYQLGP